MLGSEVIEGVICLIDCFYCYLDVSGIIGINGE